MRILKITSFYPAYLVKFYSDNPDLQNSAYATQIKKLAYDSFGWADFWSHAFRNSDHQVLEITSNNEWAQKAWAREHNLGISSGHWFTEILVAQVKLFKPEVLFFEDRNIPQETILAIKDALPNSVVSIAWCGTPFSTIEEFANFDVIIGCIPDVNEKLLAKGKTVYHLNHAFDPRVLGRIQKTSQKKYDVSFVGQMLKQGGMHSQRYAYIRLLSQYEHIHFFSPSANKTLLTRLKNMLHPFAWQLSNIAREHKQISSLLQSGSYGQRILNLNEPQEEVHSDVTARLHPPVFGLEMFQVLESSKVCFNIHIDASHKSASNMRMFEVTGVGSCLLTDKKDNMGDLFATDEVVTYSSPEECLEKIAWLTSHDRVREKIASKGQERTLRDHTFEIRAKELVKILKKIC